MKLMGVLWLSLILNGLLLWMVLIQTIDNNKVWPFIGFLVLVFGLIIFGWYVIGKVLDRKEKRRQAEFRKKFLEKQEGYFKR